MRRLAVILVVLFTCLPWLELPSTRPGVPQVRPPAAHADASLRDLVPASALLAVEVRGLERRWAEIRDTRALAGFQDAILPCFEIGPELVPGLAGDRAILFLVPAESQARVAPIAILQPEDMDGAQALLSGLEGLSCLRGRGALWIGPAGTEQLLERCALQEAAGLSSILPREENLSSLPPGGLVRGWVNPGAWVEFLSDSRMDTFPTPLRWAASALRAELAAVRYAGFRRDFAGGELVADGIVAYDPARLPPEVVQIFDPGASPAILPAELPPNALAVVAFRPETRAWLPWLRYVAASDARGPLRNLGFWLDEFQARYRRDLERDLLETFGNHGWLLAINAKDGMSTDIVVVLETRNPGAIEGTLLDLMSWTCEQVWLESFSSILPRSWHEEQRGENAGGVNLRTPFSRIPGPSFRLTDGYLIIASRPEAMQAGRAWAETLEPPGTLAEQRGHGFPAHGSILVQGPELARLIRAVPGERAAESCGCLLDAFVGLASDLETVRIDMRYEQNAIRLHGRVRFANRMQLGSKRPQTGGQKRLPRRERESLSSIALSFSRLAFTWGMPAVLIRELGAL